MPRYAIEQFEGFVGGAQASVGRLFQEIAEVQEALNDAREALRLTRRDAVESARALLTAKGPTLDAGFAATLEAGRTEYTHSLEAEAAALSQVVQQGEARSEEILKRVRALRDELRTANPELDAQEEKLKQHVAELDALATQLDGQIASRARWFGTILRRAEIRGLGEQLKKVERQFEEATASLDNVRKDWATKLGATNEEDAALQAEWAANEVRVARLRQDLAVLTTDLAAEAERRALFAMVAGSKSPPPTGDAELDASLAKVDQFSDRLDALEAAITAGSEMLGMLKGLGEGLDGFRKAVESVRAEGSSHSELPALFVEVPDFVVAFHAAWDELARYVVDEKQMAAYPEHFVHALRQLLDERLTSEGIERMFTEMGNALTRATERWNA
jgi:hypothetical protein